jgi:predicted DNA-binding transcriptional regulator AlpA
MNNDPITLSTKEAAKYLGLSPSTLAKLRLSGNGPVYSKLGRRVVYLIEKLKEWLTSREARNTSDADARLPKSLTGLLKLPPACSVEDVARLLGVQTDTVRRWIEKGLVVIGNPPPSGNGSSR